MRFIVSPETEGRERVVCVAPGRATHIHFDFVPVTGTMELKGSSCLERVSMGQGTLVLTPGRGLHKGGRCKVEVLLGDGVQPSRVSFTLVATSSGAVSRVDVLRQPPNSGTCQGEIKQLREELHQCRQEREKPSGGAERLRGLRALAADGLLGPSGVPARKLWVPPISGTKGWYGVRQIISYRLPEPVPLPEVGPARFHVAVFLQVKNKGTEPFTARGARLRSGEDAEPRTAEVWQSEPLLPGKWAWVLVEAEMTEAEARGTWRLEAWGEEELQRVEVKEVLFP